MSDFKKMVVACTVAIATIAVASTASAGCSSGFLAGGLCQLGVISPQASQAADNWNAGAGHPVDNLAHGVVDYYAPGAWEAGQAIQGAGRAIQPQFPMQPGGGMSPMPGQAVGFPGPFVPQPIRFCVTQAGANPIAPPAMPGMTCTTWTPYGPFQGIVQ